MHKQSLTIAGNIERIEERLIRACDRAGRKRVEVTLMGVSKFVPITNIKEAFNAGIRCFGESRVKEATEKFADYNDIFPGMKLHLIGALQRNKAKNALAFFDCIQSVDRLELIEELLKNSSMRKIPLEVLLELHTGEETKTGFADTDSLCRAVDLLAGSENLKIAGLMTMAPFTADAQLIRSSFRQVAGAQKELEKCFPKENFSCLSMGMSNDFEIAVEEGSTLIRIGSAIFNES
ncbi:MAG: YggS family pyridoxal phosphate-dependent enzyme [Treponema sp.]|nr:YggS family pyridoxal phosphate-dependent enzyme [Treponema sp.]MCL2251336.1 YggS family pyridoxal phosphate-dependent enzyme [Treponema sp.]